jgi:cytochrome c peroxidase
VVSATITPSVLPLSKRAAYEKYLGPTADQALNPFPNPVEQNIREKNVCQRVKTAKYKHLYAQAFGEAIDCSPNPKAAPAYKTSYKRLAVALAAWQASADVNSFSSPRDHALADDEDGQFPLDAFTPEENWGHDLFYGISSARNPFGKRAFCNACHNGVPQGQAPDPTGEAPQQLYTDNRYHHIGVPFNRQMGVAKGEKTGLAAHVINVRPGEFRTPTLRNVAKGLRADFTKAFTHNGWFKSLESLVHFYNTRDVLDTCEELGIPNATAQEALENNCWPAPEFPTPVRGIVGNLRLTLEEEAALVAYLKTLTDEHTPTKP